MPDFNNYQKANTADRISPCAVVGSGIAGLAAAHRLTERGFDVTLYEADSRPGGHACTVDVTLDGVSAPVDVGFLVYNEATYPGLTRLFRELEVPTVDSDMSFSVRNDAERIEWSGTSLSALFAQRSNVLRPGFWRMARDILRFNRLARDFVRRSRPADGSEETSVGDFLDRHAFSRELRDWYLKPMSAAIWSSPAQAIDTFSFETFARFCDNHGLLQLTGRPQWRTVAGGSREYVRRVAARLDDVRLSCPVVALRREDDRVAVVHRRDGAERVEIYRHVVLACHSDQALVLLGGGSVAEVEALGSITYQRNRAVLHTDDGLMPRSRRAWAAWNHLAAIGGGDCDETRPVAVTYWLNRLQTLPFRKPLFVTLNPPVEPAPGTTLREFEFDHPLLDARAVRAQRAVDALQGRRNIWFAGAWLGRGFHEDGLRSGYAVADALAARQLHAATQLEQAVAA